MSVKDGATGTIGQTREKAVKKQADRAALAKGKNASKADQKAMMQQAQKNRMREEMAGEGVFEVKGEVHLGESKPFFSNTTKIGAWGLNRGGKNSLKKIAMKVYKNVGYWKFIADVNGYNNEQVNDNVSIFLPDITKIAFTVNKEEKGSCATVATFSYVSIDIKKEKPIIQMSGNVEVKSIVSSSFVEYVFDGRDYNSPLVLISSVPYREYFQEIGSKPKQEKVTQKSGTYKAISSVAMGASQYSNQIDAGKSLKDGLIEGRKFQSVNKNGIWKRRVRYTEFAMYKQSNWGRGIQGYNGKFFARNLIKSGFKGTVLWTVGWAIYKAGADLAFNNGNINRSGYILGKELVKGSVTAAVGTGLTYALLLIPGLGWVGVGVIAGITTIVSLVLANKLDEIDKDMQEKGWIMKDMELT